MALRRNGFAGALGQGMSDSPFTAQNLFTPEMTLEDKLAQSGLNFNIVETPAIYVRPDGVLDEIPRKKVLVREDTGSWLSMVSEQYQTVQPSDLVSMYESWLNPLGYNLASAGTFQNGARFWCMAQLNRDAEVIDDILKSYLFLASAVDGTLATTGIGTNVKMSCWNMANTVIRDAQQNRNYVKVPHSREFNAKEFAAELDSVNKSFDLFVEEARQMARAQVTTDKAIQIIASAFGVAEPGSFNVTDDRDEMDVLEATNEAATNKRVIEVRDLFEGAGIGADMKSQRGTAWGVFNAITQYVDHGAKTASPENRFHSATLGAGAKVKERAYQECLRLAA